MPRRRLISTFTSYSLRKHCRCVIVSVILQMWLEKLCKAYLWSIRKPPDDLLQKHNVIAKVLPSLVLEHWSRVGLEKRRYPYTIRELCREIDLLQPQIKSGNRRPHNAEYPWLGDAGAIEAPVQWEFPVARALYSNSGKLLLKAAVRLTRNPALFVGREPPV